MNPIDRAKVLESTARMLGWTDEQLLEACALIAKVDKLTPKVNSSQLN